VLDREGDERTLPGFQVLTAQVERRLDQGRSSDVDGLQLTEFDFALASASADLFDDGVGERLPAVL
jgi:hypothetical protein